MIMHEIGKKGVSPLIAAVMLIAFTMGVAGILTAWLTTYTHTTTTAIGNQSEQIIKCSYGGLSIYEALYATATERVYVSTANIGTVNFRNVTISAITEGNRTGWNWTGELNTAEVKTVSMKVGSTKPDKILAIAVDCPNVQDEEIKENIQTG